jgi:hypothetical protein
MNDSDETLTSAEKTWTLVIDGKEVANSGTIFRNGPGPIGGYEKVPSGATFEFGKGFPLTEYFSEHRDYKVSWKSEAFQSNTVTVRGGTEDR